MLCQNEEGGEDGAVPSTDEEMSTGDPAHGSTSSSGETVDGPLMLNDNFIDMLWEAFFFLSLSFFSSDSLGNVLGCDETKC